MAEKKTIFEKYIKPIGITVILGAIGWVIIWFINDSNRNHDVDQKIFPTVADLNETLENNAAKPSEKEVYIMGQEALAIKKQSLIYQEQIIAQGDTLQKQATYFKEQTQRIDSFYIFAKKKIEKDSMVEKKKEESRAGRDATNREILRLLKDLKNNSNN